MTTIAEKMLKILEDRGLEIDDFIGMLEQHPDEDVYELFLKFVMKGNPDNRINAPVDRETPLCWGDGPKALQQEEQEP